MNTFNKIKLNFIVSAASTLLAVVLKTVAMFTEFDSTVGYFYNNARINFLANILIVVAVVFFAAFSFSFKKREIFPVINYSSSLFRFFASTSGCLMLVYAYVKWQEYLTEKAVLSNANAKKTNFLFAMAVLAVASGLALMIYAFGKNEKNKPTRAFLCALPAGVALVRAIEIQFDGTIEMNDPLKISLQLASIALIVGIVYTAKCEFDINETTPRMRLISLMVAPVVVLSFAIPTVICYYARVNMIFTYLIDALLYLSLCGFVIFSYTPCAKAKPICDEKWKEYDRQVDIMNGKAVDEENSDEDSAITKDEAPEDEGLLLKTDGEDDNDTGNDTNLADGKNSEDETETENTEEL